MKKTNVCIYTGEEYRYWFSTCHHPSGHRTPTHDHTSVVSRRAYLQQNRNP